MACISSRLSCYSKVLSRLQMWKSLALFVLVLCCFVQVTVCFGFRGKGTGIKGKIGANLPGVELADYRFGLGTPYVIFYERDNYRGTVYFQTLAKACKNLPEERQNWASSIDVQKRCIMLCDELDCTGTCAKVYAHPEDPNNKGASKLSAYNLSDKVKSVKYCYP